MSAIEMKRYVVVYYPFPGLSDVTAENIEMGIDAEDALKNFRTKFPKWDVVRVEETN